MNPLHIRSEMHLRFSNTARRGMYMTTASSLSSVSGHIPWSGIITSDLATSISQGTEFVVGDPELVASLDAAAAAAAVAGTSNGDKSSSQGSMCV
jgi:hypothetical protein